jgi:dihydropyrimidinase
MRTLDVVIRGGTAVTPWGRAAIDVGIDGSGIGALARSPSDLVGDEEVDASGLLVLPGAVDPHVHFENPSFGPVTAHDFGLGTEAAALGGTTTIIDFAIQQPDETPLDAIRRRRAAAEAKVVIDFGFHACITDPSETSLDEIPAVVEAGCPSMKMFMVYDPWKLDDGSMLEIMRRQAAAGGMVLVHAENEQLVQWGIRRRCEAGDLSPGAHARSRPAIVESDAIQRIGLFSVATGCSVYVVHVSSAAGFAAVERARSFGAQMWCETCPHYLVLDDSALDGPEGHRFVMTPPLRTVADQDALWDGLASGRMESTGSDDAAFHEEFKLAGVDDFRKCANGVPGVQLRVPLLFSEGVMAGRLGLERFVSAVAEQPARLFGLYPRKGALAPGSDADIVVYDPEVVWEPTVANMHTNIEYTCYEDRQVRGRPAHVWSRGRRVVADGELVAERGSGTFLARPLEHPGRAAA